jgi:hypothetical protein
VSILPIPSPTPTLTPIPTPTITPTPTPTVGQVYAQEMELAIQKLELWLNGPVAEWDTNWVTKVPNTNITNGVLLFGIMSSKWSPPVYTGEVYANSDTETKAMIDGLFSFLPIAQKISTEGFDVLSVIGGITPPQSISIAHNRIESCVEYKTNWASDMVKYYEAGILPLIGSDPCTLMAQALEQVKSFIEDNK